MPTLYFENSKKLYKISRKEAKFRFFFLMKNVSKFWTRRCTSLKLMVVYCFRQILDPADIIVPAMMFCDDIKSHIIRHF